jgi:S-adenosylmethionine decarboxylase
LPLASGSVDGIYSMGTVEHFAETEAAVAEIARVLRPGGRLVLGVPNRHDPFLRPLMVAVLHKAGLYGYGFEKNYSRRQLRGMVERAGLNTARETAILFIPGWLRMLDLWCYTRVRPLARVTGALVQPFVWMDRHLPFVRRHGYLIVNVADKPRAGSGRESSVVHSAGVQYIVDASGCDPNALRSMAVLQSLFRDIIGSIGLTTIGAPLWHAFPGEGGVTGITMLSESHLSVHTYPETGHAAFDLYCCRPNAEWPWNDRLASALGATTVTVRVVPRTQTN